MDNSRLAKLPPELRNRIYELVFTTEDKPVDLVPNFKRPGTVQQNSSTSRTLPIALTQTCRAIREEASQMFYSSITFSFTAARGTDGVFIPPESVAREFLERLHPDHAKAVREIVLDVGDQAVVGRSGAGRFYVSDPRHDVDGIALMELKTMLAYLSKMAESLRALAPRGRVFLVVVFEDLHNRCEMGVRSRSGGEGIEWEQSMKSVEGKIKKCDEGNLVKQADFGRWVVSLVERVRVEWEEILEWEEFPAPWEKIEFDFEGF